MISFLQTYQLDIMLVLLGVCAATAIFVSVLSTLPGSRKQALLSMEINVIILLIADRAAYLYRGDVSSTGFWMVRISNFLVFAMTLMVLLSLNRYLEDLYLNEGGLSKLPRRIFFAYMFIIAGLVLLVISQFTGLYYTFDETNHYRRSGGYIISFILPMAVLAMQLSVIIQYRHNLHRLITRSLLLFTILPIVASILQVFIYGISLINMTIEGMVVVVVVFCILDMEQEVDRAHNLQVRVLREEEEQSRRLFDQLTQALANAIDAKDTYTRGHSSRVAEYARCIAGIYGKSEKECEEIYRAAMLHDVGKIGIPDSIINKRGRLTEEEYDTIKNHPVIGRDILSTIESESLSNGANYHHERYDGSGYPEGKAGREIPELARIIAVADAYDAMTSNRSYRKALGQEEVRAEIEKGLGTQFDPEFGRIMLRLIDEDREYQMREH